ncbi:hypothetical protein NH340_JMT09283 [Sarcoptes scabiei]|nr:hypothetical protein NH340_JMT09283 [Sarcoptes scabiei]
MSINNSINRSIENQSLFKAAIEKNYPHRLKIEFNDRKIFSLSNEEKNHKLSIISNDPNGLDRNNNDCLSICQCKWKSGKETANCDHRSLLSIPNGLSTTTQVIDLSGNVLTKLPPMVFVQRGLINLQRIYLADCQLIDVSAESFVKLSNLIELDLSNNSLTTIPSQSLAECPGLRRLSLAGNRISDIKSRSFLPLIKLNWLDLSRNVIYHLDSDAFIGLRSLQMLKIQSNRLQTIMGAHSFVNYLSKRLSLEMHDNQWHCDCHLGPLRDWILENSISIAIKPICSMPERLKDQTWDSIPIEQFSCPPSIQSVNTHFYKHIGNNVTITCSVSGFPSPKILWLFETAELHRSNKIVVDNFEEFHSKTAIKSSSNNDLERRNFPPKQQPLPSKRYSLVEELDQSGVITSKLTVHSLQPIDTQRIVCYAKNVGGEATKNFSLIVSTQEPFSSSRSMDLLVSEFMLIVVAICVLLLLLIIFLFVMIFRRKSNSNNSSRTNHVTDSSILSKVNQIDFLEKKNEFPPISSKTVIDDEIVRRSPNKSLHLDPNSFLTPPYHEIQARQQSQPSAIRIAENIDGYLSPSSNILLVNTIDMLSTKMNHQTENQFVSNPSISTDLSSQSTNLTSLNGNVRNASPNQNNQTNNSTDSGNSQIFLPSFDGSPSLSRSISNRISPNHLHHNQNQPDILVSSSAYYLTPSCNGSQFPLLNSGPWFTESSTPTINHNQMIYGKTKMTPTRIFSQSKLKFSETINNESQFPSNNHLHPTSSICSSDSIMASNNAFTIATIRRPKISNSIESNRMNRAIGNDHRTISSFPDGLRLIESSVDSGESIRLSDHHIDETEEDEYYKNNMESQQHI